MPDATSMAEDFASGRDVQGLPSAPTGENARLLRAALSVETVLNV